jgi:hypothetical protein
MPVSRSVNQDSLQLSEDRSMSALFSTDAALLSRAVVVGILGGTGLLLGYRFSTRGPIMFPIYAGILFVSSLVVGQFPGLSFMARFRAVMLAMLISTALVMAGVIYNARRRDRIRAKQGKPPIEGHAPWWSAPFVIATVAAASACVAFLVR